MPRSRRSPITEHSRQDCRSIRRYPRNVFQRFTDRARKIVVLAQEEARLLNHGFIGTEHLLLGLIQEGEGVAAKALDSLGISIEAARGKVVEMAGVGTPAPSGSLPFNPRGKKVLELALREALQLGHSFVDTEHILLGLAREGEGVAARVLVSLGTDLGSVRWQVIESLGGEVAPQNRLVGPQRSAPKCPQCHVDLVDVARFRRIAVAPGSADEGGETISVAMVYCSGCGATLEMFKADPPTGSPA